MNVLLVEKMNNMSKTTAKDFKIYKKAIRLWIDKFGLSDWRVEVLHKKDINDSRGSVTYNSGERCCTIFLAPTWENDIEPTKEILECTALEEVLHVLFARLTTLAVDRYLQHENDINEEEHSVIHKIERVLLDKK